jgi:hypothetical protein
MSLPIPPTAAPVEEPLLEIFVLPYGCDGSDRLRLSLVLELNTGHPAFGESPTLEARNEWLGWMDKFYASLRAYSQPQQLTVTVGGTRCEGLREVPSGFTARSARAEELFEQFVLAAAYRREKKLQQSSVVDTKPLASPPPIWKVKASEPTARVRFTQQQQQQQQQQTPRLPEALPTLTVADALKEIARTQIDGLEQLTPQDQANILEASRYVDELNRQRNRQLTGEPVEALKRATSSLVNPATALSGLLDFVNWKATALHEAVVDQPTAVLVAYDLLGNSLSLRRWIGTILDLEVRLPADLAAGTHLVTVQLGDATGPNVLTSSEFGRTNATNFRFGPPVPTGPRWVELDHKGPWIDQGFVKLTAICRIEHAETEARLRNTNQALSTAAIQADAAGPQPEGLMSAKAKLLNLEASLLNALPFPTTAAAPLVTAAGRLAFLQAQQSRSLVRQAVKHITNLRTKGHSLNLIEHPDPPTKSDPNTPRPPVGTPIPAADLVGGYVVYARRENRNAVAPESGTTSRWEALCTVSEELTDGGVSQFERSQPMGLALGNGVLTRDENAGNDAPLRPLADLFLCVYDGLNMATRNPLRHADEPLAPAPKPPAAAGPAVSGKAKSAQLLTPEQADLHAATLEVARLQIRAQVLDTTQAEVSVVHKNTVAVLGSDDFPFSRAANLPRWMLLRQAQELRDCRPSTAKLLFPGVGHNYQYRYLALTQYRNGYVPARQLVEQNSSPDQLQGYASMPTPFFRQEHIGDVVVSLRESIYEADGKRALPRHLGESPHHLVVRTGELLNSRSCERYLLPPLTPSFQTLLWSDPEWQRKLGPEAYRWFLRSQCQVTCETEFANNGAVNNVRRRFGNDTLPATGCAAGCERHCGRSEQPLVYDGHLHYLPDPAVTGLHVAFFLDEACLTPADSLEYAPLTLSWPNARQQYPDLKAWRLVLRKDRHPQRLRQSKTAYNAVRRLLVVHLRPGMQLFALVTPTFSRPDSPFDHQQALLNPLVKNADARQQALKAILQRSPPPSNAPEYTVDYLLANSVRLTLTHATQKPLLAPVLQPGSVRLLRSDAAMPGGGGQPPKRADASFAVQARVHFEHLNVPQGCYLAELPPTGELELFALWNDFKDTSPVPSPSIDDKRDGRRPNGGFLRVSALNFTRAAVEPPALLPGTVGDHQRRCEQLLAFESDPSILVPHHTDMVLRVRNISRFQQYFVRDSEREQPGRVPLSLDERRELEAQKEPFARWSAEYRLSDYYQLPQTRPVGAAISLNEFQANYLPNNAKPQALRICKVVPLQLQDDDLSNRKRTWRGNRYRFYLLADYLRQSGQNSWVAIPVYTPTGAYPAFLQPWLARGGTDAVTDTTTASAQLESSTSNSYLTSSNFCLNATDLEADYLGRFQPQLNGRPEGKTLGVVSYSPQFDEAQQLWYVDVQFNLRNRVGAEPHNAFVQFGLANFQPLSANYNELASVDVDNEDRFAHDLRLSVPTLVDFFSVLPSRRFGNPYVLFLDRQTEHFSLACQMSSLFLRERENVRTLATQFVLVAEQRTVGDVWKLVPSELISHKTQVDNEAVKLPTNAGRRFYHPLLPADLVQQVPTAPLQAMVECTAKLQIEARRGWFLHRTHLRVAVYEVDWHDESPSGLETLHSQLARLENSLSAAEQPLASPIQIPGLRVRNCTVFWEHSRDEV